MSKRGEARRKKGVPRSLKPNHAVTSFGKRKEKGKCEIWPRRFWGRSHDNWPLEFLPNVSPGVTRLSVTQGIVNPTDRHHQPLHLFSSLFSLSLPSRPLSPSSLFSLFPPFPPFPSPSPALTFPSLLVLSPLPLPLPPSFPFSVFFCYWLDGTRKKKVFGVVFWESLGSFSEYVGSLFFYGVLWGYWGLFGIPWGGFWGPSWNLWGHWVLSGIPWGHWGLSGIV